MCDPHMTIELHQPDAGGWTRWLPPCGSGRTTRRRSSCIPGIWAGCGGSAPWRRRRRPGRGAGTESFSPSGSSTGTSWCGWRSRRTLSRTRRCRGSWSRDLSEPGRGVLRRGHGVHRGAAGALGPGSAVRGRLEPDEPWTRCDAISRGRWRAQACGSRSSGRSRRAMRTAVQRASFDEVDVHRRALARDGGRAGVRRRAVSGRVQRSGRRGGGGDGVVGRAGKPGLLEPMGVHRNIAVTATAGRSPSPRRPHCRSWARRARSCAPRAPTSAPSRRTGRRASGRSRNGWIFAATSCVVSSVGVSQQPQHERWGSPRTDTEPADPAGRDHLKRVATRPARRRTKGAPHDTAHTPSGRSHRRRRPACQRRGDRGSRSCADVCASHVPRPAAHHHSGGQHRAGQRRPEPLRRRGRPTVAGRACTGATSW